MAISKDDQDRLIKKFAPKLYFHPDEIYLPASVEWFLERTNLTSDNGSILYSVVANTKNLLSLKPNNGFHLNLNRENDRYGMGANSPLYASVIEISQGGRAVGYEIGYWAFFPFNGNIFNFKKANAILSGIAVGSLLFSFFLGPLGPIGAATAIAAIVYLNRLDGLQMHEGDWEHITVRVDTKDNIIGIYFSAHDGGSWALQPAIDGSNSSEGYHLEGVRPFVYIADASHAFYSYLGTLKRVGGLANDNMGNGQLWDPLEQASSAKPLGELINIGHSLSSPPHDSEWLKFPGRWGKKGSKPFPIKLFGLEEEIVEYTGGPTSPAYKSWWHNGEEEGPTTWPDNITPLPHGVPSTHSLAMTTYNDILCLVYTARNAQGKVHFSYFDGVYWEPIDIPHIGLLSDDNQITIASYLDKIQAIYRVGKTLKWATMEIDDKFKIHGWQHNSLPPMFNDYLASNTFDSGTYEGKLYLLSSREESDDQAKLGVFTYNGIDWEDLLFNDSQVSPPKTNGLYSLSSYNGLLYIAYADPNDDIYVITYNIAVNVWERLPSLTIKRKTKLSLNVRDFGGYLYLLYTDTNNILRWSRYNQTTGWLYDEKDRADYTVDKYHCSGGLVISPDLTDEFLMVVFTNDDHGPGKLYLTDITAS